MQRSSLFYNRSLHLAALRLRKSKTLKRTGKEDTEGQSKNKILKSLLPLLSLFLCVSKALNFCYLATFPVIVRGGDL
jgi:hypothetical protein